MTCREFIEVFLDAWLDGELPPRRTDTCDEHARTCGDCAEYARRHRQLLAALRSERLAVSECKALPEDLVASIVASAGVSTSKGTEGAVGS